MNKTTSKFYVILDNIRSRENVGSIFRTADGAGVSKIYLCGITPTPKMINPEKINPELYLYYDRIKNPIPATPKTPNFNNSGFNNFDDKISKTALGAEKWVPWEYHKQTWRLLKELRANGLQVTALEQTKNSKNIFEFRAIDRRPLAIVVGNEVKGLSYKILSYCDDVVHIPMYGRKESLNVAVAAGVAIYTLLSSE